MVRFDKKGAVPAASLISALTIGLAPPAPSLGETPTIPPAAVLEPDAGRSNDRFGSSVALGDGIALIGAPNLSFPFIPPVPPLPRGAVFFFDPETGEELGMIQSPYTSLSSSFGSPIALKGRTLAIGGSNGQQHARGDVHVYDTTMQQQLFALIPESEDPIEDFGFQIAVNESIIAVSGYRGEGRTNRNGSVFLFDRSTGDQIAELRPDGGSEGDDFGVSLAMNEDRLVVGAITDDEQGSVAGAAYLFDLSDRSQIAKIFAINGPSAYFGSSVAMDDHTIAIGNPFNNDNGTAVGAVHLYDASTGAPLRRIDPNEIVDFMGFGSNVILDGGSVFVASGLPEDVTMSAVHLFDITTGTQEALLLPDSLMPNQRFGGAIAARGPTVLIGAPYFQGSTPPGQAFLFSLTCPTDTTGDGTVDLADLNLVLTNFGLHTSHGDTNGDGVVDLVDLNAVLAAFGTDCF